MPIETVPTPYGYRCVLKDPISLEERRLWLEQIKAHADRPGFYGQLIDIRETVPDPAEAPQIAEGMAYVRSHGLRRSAVVVSSAKTALTIKQLAWQSGVLEWERYFDASQDPDWEQHAEGWIMQRIDPEH
ncbi:MAG TPA: hypothetical protein VFP72_14335 [Kineosporiaceae bacterium]|nr:hypothetical protein [Kineosporiaceae bacterium]